MKRIVMIILLMSMMLLNGCTAIKFFKPGGSNPANSYIKNKNYEYEYYRNKIAGVTIKTVKKNSTKTTPKKTLGQKIGGWFAGLTTLGIILVVVGLFLAPATTIGVVISMWRRARRALIATVRAIKEVRADEEDTLHNSLNKYHTKDTKRTVSEIKSEL